VKVLSSLRKQKGVTQQAVADYLGITQQAYANYESNKRQADNITLAKLADFFNVSTDYLLGRTESPMPAQEPSEDDALRAEVLDLMADLSDQDFQRVLDFVAGLKAARAKE